MTDLLKELEAVAEMIPDDWDWYKCKECGAKTNGDPWPEITSFIRTHHAEIAEALKDARRYRWLLANAQTIEGRQDWYWWADDADVTPLTARIDSAIDAMNNSAR